MHRQEVIQVSRILPFLLLSAALVGCRGDEVGVAEPEVPSTGQSSADLLPATSPRDANPFLGAWRLLTIANGDEEYVAGTDVFSAVVTFWGNGTYEMSVSDDAAHNLCDASETSCSWGGTYEYTRTLLTLNEEGGPEPGEDSSLYAVCGGRLMIMDSGDGLGTRYTFAPTRRDCFAKECG
jgi:hypothetical protein